MSTVDLTARIPNNVDLGQDKRLLRALEQWQPNYLDWWREMGPTDFQEKDVWLRTAISVDAEGWAHFDYVKMPDYRWGIFLADPAARPAASASATPWASRPGREVPGRASQHAAPPDRHPGRHRARERRAAA